MIASVCGVIFIWSCSNQLLPIADSNVSPNDKIITKQLVDPDGHFLVCYALYKSPHSLIVGVTKRDIATITAKSADLMVITSSKEKLAVTIGGSVIEHIEVIDGIVTVALNEEHFGQFRDAGFLMLDQQRISYDEISDLYNQARKCSRQ